VYPALAEPGRAGQSWGMSEPLIYLVEDDPEIRTLVAALLTREGMACEPASDAAIFWSLFGS
jgi:hypothetical protein